MGDIDRRSGEGFLPCPLVTGSSYFSCPSPKLSLTEQRGGSLGLVQCCEVSQVMLHPGHDGTCRGCVRAQAGHHEAEQDPTRALVLVHAGPQSEMQAAWPQPLASHGELPSIHYPSPSCQEPRGRDTKVVPGARSGWALMPVYGLPSEVGRERTVRGTAMCSWCSC